MKNKNLVKLLAAVVSLVLAFSLAACGNTTDDNSNTSAESKDTVTVKIGVTGENYADIWKPTIDTLAKEGIDIELVQFSDYTLPNAALDNGEIDLNSFQHHAYFNNEVDSKGYQLTSIGDTFISAMNIYSHSISNVSELKDGDKIALPNDATNEGRALKVLAAAGVITLDAAAGASPELTDITDNPKNIEFVEADAANIPSLLDDVAAAVINANYAIDYDINPGKDYIFLDDPSYYSDDSYVNLIAARTEDKDNEVYKKIVETYQSEATKQVYADAFSGAYIAAW